MTLRAVNACMASTPFGKINVAFASASPAGSHPLVTALSGIPELDLWNAGAEPLDFLDHPDRLANVQVIVLVAGPSLVDMRLLLRRFSLESTPQFFIDTTGLEIGSEQVIDLFNAGAVDVVAAVRAVSFSSLSAAVDRLLKSIRSVARVRQDLPARPASVRGVVPGSAPLPTRISPTGVRYHPRQILLIGASTGGTEAIRDVLTKLPSDLPGICIVQHIPAAFSKCFAARMNDLCQMEVREAVNGDVVRSGLALVAPGGFHMELRWRASSGHYEVRLQQGPLEHYQRPAVDVLFRTGAHAAGRHALAVLLTGMGRDGALGMRELREARAVNLAQDEKTCVVFGMPGSACELGVVDSVVPLPEMASAILRRLQSMSAVQAAPVLSERMS